jgi:glycosyltransferase involved in cell wall biosynthesis
MCTVKIVFIAPFGIRPKGTLIARMIPLAAALQEKGHEVVIVAPPYTNPEDSGRVETVEGVTVRNVTLGPVQGGAAAPLLGWRLFRAALAEQPDLVHLFKPKGYGGLAGMLLVAAGKVGLRMPPLFVDTDDWEGKGGMNASRPYSRIERAVFQVQEQWLPVHAAGVTVASRTLQTLVWGMGVAPGKVLYLPNCVKDTPRGHGLAVRERLGIPAAAPVVLLYTRFFEFSQERLHRVCAEIFRQVPSVRFLVAGKGRNDEEQALLAAGERLGFARALVMAGWVEPERLPDLLAAGDVAIYPFDDTLVNRSKCPAKLTELLRAERAVVADRVGQLAEYIEPGSSGILCNPGDSQAMADKVVHLLHHPEERDLLGRAGRHHLLESFNWQTHAGELARFYRHCLEQGGTTQQERDTVA